MNLIILQPTEVDESGRAVLKDDRARHIRSVLKAEEGKELRVGLLNGFPGTGVVEQIDRKQVVLKCCFDAVMPLAPNIDLILAMPRPKVMKRLWAQLAALGVGRIVLLRADKVERYYFDSHVLEKEFYTKLLIEGLQQARCVHLPEVLIRPLFKPFVEDELEMMFVEERKLLADPSGLKPIGSAIETLKKPKRIVLAIGPEGGWTSYELDAMQARGFEVFSMGARVLRTDTAIIGSLSVLADRMQDR